MVVSSFIYSNTLAKRTDTLHWCSRPAPLRGCVACQLVSVAPLLTVHPYWALAGVALHLVLPGVHRCRTDICVHTLRFCISPFTVTGSVTARRVLHAIHCLGNTAVTVVWALGTPLASAHPWRPHTRPCTLPSSAATRLCLLWEWWAGNCTSTTGPRVIPRYTD